MAVVEVLKYNGKPDVFAWKYPSEELGTWTQLIVNESQEAVLVKSGKIFDIFGSGRHTLDTANIPLLNRFINLPFGGKSPFTAEVWYINKAYQLDIKWGTPTPVQIQDPKYGIFVPVRANGAFGIHIADTETFLTKLVGTMPVFDAASITKYFRGLYITKIKDALSTYLIHRQISVLEINAYIDEISQYMKEGLQPVISAYGIELVSFYVNEISVPEEDSAVKKLKDALSKRAEMNIVGYSYQQERTFNTLEGAASTPGSGAAPLMGAGMGLGMGLGVGKGIGDGFGDLAQTLQSKDGSEETKECLRCHAPVPRQQRFCGSCGFDTEKISEERTESGILCTVCGNIAAKNSKFCPECGHMLAGSCPRCNTPLEGSPKFCPQCGEKL
ncbi:MAG: SPFH domain-containing protein [Clostridiales bacterium]|nr:SPFH domain-containing protein [Clostridiales bacterium]